MWNLQVCLQPAFERNCYVLNWFIMQEPVSYKRRYVPYRPCVHLNVILTLHSFMEALGGTGVSASAKYWQLGTTVCKRKLSHNLNFCGAGVMLIVIFCFPTYSWNFIECRKRFHSYKGIKAHIELCSLQTTCGLRKEQIGM
jgi:hypothetical protein